MKHLTILMLFLTFSGNIFGSIWSTQKKYISLGASYLPNENISGDLALGLAYWGIVGWRNQAGIEITRDSPVGFCFKSIVNIGPLNGGISMGYVQNIFFEPQLGFMLKKGIPLELSLGYRFYAAEKSNSQLQLSIAALFLW
jgi:hypothetical protein